MEQLPRPNNAAVFGFVIDGMAAGVGAAIIAAMTMHVATEPPEIVTGAVLGALAVAILAYIASTLRRAYRAGALAATLLAAIAIPAVFIVVAISGIARLPHP